MAKYLPPRFMKLTLVIACLLIGWRGTTAQGLTRIAGVGIGGYNGDNKPATSAELNNTTGLVKDKAGNIYISEAGNERVRKINTSGIITTIAGNGSAGYTGDNGQAVYATLSSPCALAIDSAGNLYVADQGNGVIRRIDTFGIITTIVTGVSAPSGLAFDKAGNLYIAEQTGYVITRVDPQGNQTTVAGTGTSGDSGDFGSALLADISSPYGITVDATGNIFFYRAIRLCA